MNHLNLDTAFEPTPVAFHQQLEAHLSSLLGQACQTSQAYPASQALQRPARKKVRWVPLVAGFSLLLALTAFAASRLGVLFFLTERTSMPMDTQQVLDNTVSATSQQSEGGLVTAELRDAILLEDTFTFCLNVQPLDMETYALLCKQSIGTDGENYDWVWADGNIYRSLAEWTPQGKQALIVSDPHVTLGDYPMYCSFDYVPEGNSCTFLMEARLDEMEIIHDIKLKDLLDENGNLEVGFTIDTLIENQGEPQRTTLTTRIPCRLEEEAQ